MAVGSPEGGTERMMAAMAAGSPVAKISSMIFCVGPGGGGEFRELLRKSGGEAGGDGCLAGVDGEGGKGSLGKFQRVWQGVRGWGLLLETGWWRFRR